jgi:glutamate synthase (NADPH/NADH) large chain
VREGVNIIILSDRAAGSDRIPIPSLLATAAVHHHLIRTGLRTSVGLVSIRRAARSASLRLSRRLRRGSDQPVSGVRSIIAMKEQLPAKLDDKEIVKRYIKSIGKGLLKVMSKMGISTYQSYCGAQIFDAVGLKADFVAKYFAGTHTRIEGVGLAEIAEETTRRHGEAFGDTRSTRARSMSAANTPSARAARITPGTPRPCRCCSTRCAAIRRTVTGPSQSAERAVEKLLTCAACSSSSPPRTTSASRAARRSRAGQGDRQALRHRRDVVRLDLARGAHHARDRDEPHRRQVEHRRRRRRADRFKPMANGDSMRSAIKQVASGRFGVTTEYLVNSDMMQIKMAQGAKPGEGGQLPGHKVDATIAKVRHSTPGVGLISPPPHHDIYSIEDLAQLIYDLKNVNPDGQVSVKLVSEIGVGTVAAGVAKARADHVTISGFEGGTGASPLTSIKHAGSPWELGLAETQQTLVLNACAAASRCRSTADSAPAATS